MSVETVMDSIHAANDVIVGAAEQDPDLTPFDQSCMTLMDRVAAFFGEAAGHPDFCGLGVDEMRDADGKVVSLRLVPCDMVDGMPIRRVGK